MSDKKLSLIQEATFNVSTILKILTYLFYIVDSEGLN